MVVEPPFPRLLQLNNEPCPPSSAADPSDTIPGHPSLPLQPSKVLEFLHQELDTAVINDLHPYMPFVARKSAANIDPLHFQLIKRRKILVTEDPALHLVWWNDTIFVKPIPLCLGNWAFWEHWMCYGGDIDRNYDSNSDSAESAKDTAKDAVADWPAATKWCPVSAATGFLRTYAYLIRHPSDFRIALDCGLIPADVEYAAFALFIGCFHKLSDRLVSPRYEYGQLRLTRLNLAVHLLRPRAAKGAWNYQETYWQTGQYLSSFARPLMFVFGSVAAMLSAMQVVVSIPDPGLVMNESGWRAMRQASWGTSVVVIVLVLLIWVALLGGVGCLLLAQLTFSIRQLRSQ
jgi:hypothetical protein